MPLPTTTRCPLTLLFVLLFVLTTASPALADSSLVDWIAGTQDWRNCTIPISLALDRVHSQDADATEAEVYDADTGRALTVRFVDTVAKGNTTFRLSSMPKPGMGDRTLSLAEVSGFATCTGTHNVAVRRLPAGDVISGPHSAKVSLPIVPASNAPLSFAYEKVSSAGFVPCAQVPASRRTLSQSEPGAKIRVLVDESHCDGSGGDAKVVTKTFEAEISESKAKELTPRAPWLESSFPAVAPRWATVQSRNPQTAMICDCGERTSTFNVTWSEASSGFPKSMSIANYFACGCGTTLPGPISVPVNIVAEFMGSMDDFIKKVVEEQGGLVDPSAAAVIQPFGIFFTIYILALSLFWN